MKHLHTVFIAATIMIPLGCGGSFSSDYDGEELIGAGGRDLTEYWVSVPIPHSQNTKNLNFQMMGNKVKSATGLNCGPSEQSRQTFGAPDYIENWSEDRVINQQKINGWRAIVMECCEELVTQDAGKANRSYFTVIDPAANINIAAIPVTQQIDAMHQRMFLEEVSTSDLQESLTLLSELQTEESPEIAWQGLCVAYMSSMRFLSY